MTRLPLKICAAVLAAITTLGAFVTTPRANAQSVTNFGADVNTAINRGLDYLDRAGAFNENVQWLGGAKGLIVLALLEKRVDASATAVSQGYVRGSAADKARVDRVVASLVSTRLQPFEAYQNGSELMGLALYVRTGGLQSTAPGAGVLALDALDRAVDEALDPIDFSSSPPRLVSTGEPWTGYWTYEVAGGYDASGAQFVVAGLAAARGAYMQADRGGRLAKINQALAYTRGVYAGEIDPNTFPAPGFDHGLRGEACGPGGPLSTTERGKGYGIPWVGCSVEDGILHGISNSSQQTGSGLWIQLVGGSTLNSHGVQAYLEWMRNRYQHTSINGQAFSFVSYGYYLWTAAKAYTFLDRSGAVPDPGNLSTADVGVLSPGGSIWSGAETHYDPSTVSRPATFGAPTPGYYADPRESARWYFDFAYDVMSRQCFGGQPAALSTPIPYDYIPLHPCTASDSDGYFVPVNGRYGGFEKNFAEQVFHILVLQRSVGGGCIDSDNDGLCDTEDNCPAVDNTDQADGDGDGLGDVCDNCQYYNPDQLDSNDDGVGDSCATAPTVEANDDSGSVTTAGGVAVAAVLTNDSLNHLAVLPTAVNTAFVSATHTGVSLVGNSVLVTAGTPVGVYTLIYRICEVLNPSNCDGATVTVTVSDGSGDVIDAVNDQSGTVNGLDGQADVLDVLADNGSGPDTVNGSAADENSAVVVSWESSHPNVTLDGSRVQVAADTPTGTYTVHYRICVAIALTPCDEADVTIPVVVPGIHANDDEGEAVNSADGGVSLANVLVNDTLGPEQAVDVASQLSLAQLSSGHPGVHLDGVSVVVDPGTPGGDYELVYRLCEIADPLNCDNATVFVRVRMVNLVANDDAGPTVNGLTGGIGFANILANDTWDGAPATPAGLDIVQVNESLTDVYLEPGTVDVLVRPGTPAGTYVLRYEICVTESYGNSCDEADVTVRVVWGQIDATDDVGPPVVGSVGGVSVANILANDTMGGATATLSNTVISLVSGSARLTLGTTTGAVSVLPATPVGTYTLTYRICEQLNLSNCDNAIVTVPVIAAPIDAKDDLGASVTGATGGLAVANVLVNDTLNATPVTLANVTLAFLNGTAGLSLNPATGAVTVAPGTPANPGATLSYQICEILNPANCDIAVVAVPILAAAIDAVDDAGTAVNGATGGVALASVLAADTLNHIVATFGGVTLSYVSGSAGLVLNAATGAVTVLPGTAANPTATLTYRICEILNPSNCDTATVTVPVTAAPIDAVNDNGASINGATGGVALASVLTNDTLNSSPATLVNVVLSYVNGPAALVLNPATGSVTVLPGTAAGSYALTYRICEVLNPTNCDTATVTAPVTAAPIDAVNDNGASVNGAAGGQALANVLGNDTLNGGPATLLNVVLSYVSGSAPLVLAPATGAVTVLPGTPAGNYSLTYSICELLNPTNCDTATVAVPVTAPAIDAVNDAGVSVSGLTGGIALGNVLVNDTLNGVPATLATVTVSYVSGSAGLSLNATTGTVTVAAGTPVNAAATLVYRICDKLNPTNCDTATVTVPVTAATIDAMDDTASSVNGALGGSVLANVLVNDTLNGAPVSLATVTLSFVSGTPGVTLNAATGAVSVAAGTAANPTATLVYRICEILNPSNCDNATVTVPITAAVIDAVNDAGTSIVGAAGGQAVASVLGNDTLNGVPATVANVTLSFVSGTTGLTLNAATGAVTVAAGTAANPSATLVYRICEKLNPSNCDEATVTVPIVAAVIDAVNDSASSINGASGGLALATVLTNDTLNGVAATLSNVTLTFVSGSTGLSLNTATGAVSVAAGTMASPVGAPYVLTYRICETINPTNCDTATVTVPVIAATIDAINDSGTANGLAGGTAVNNVLGNDTLNSILAALGLVTTTQVSTSNPGVTLSGTTVSVAAGTPAGSYTLTYSICETLNPSNCDQAVVTVTVNAPPIDAVNDNGTANGETGGTAVADVLANDTLNGTSVSSTAVTVSQVSTSHTGVTLSGRSVVVAAGTPAGTYTLTYSICEILNPTNCDTATVTVNVTVPNKVPTAVDDAVTTNEDTAVSNTAASNDTAGDSPNTWALVGANGGAAHGTVTMGANGAYTYTPTANYNGVDVFSYRVCDRDNDCSTARVTITITPVDDTPAAVNDTNSSTGAAVTASVTANDTQSGDGGNVWSLVGTNGGSTNATVTITAAGTYTYTPNSTFSGTDTFSYRICDADGDCATATVTVTVTRTNKPPVAVNDSATTNKGTPVTIAVLTNDSDPDGNTLTITSNTAPGSGTLVKNANGTFTYTPTSTFTGTVTFTYTISDGKGGTATATVTILVKSTTTCGNSSDDHSNDDHSSDDRSHDGRYSRKNRDGRSNDGGSGDHGSDDHSSDGNSGCSTGNKAPKAVDDNATTPAGTPVTITVLSNDSDPNGDTLTVTSVSTPSKGTVVKNSNGTVTYTPPSGFTGTATFTYTISDGKGGTATATVCVTVTAVNKPPVAVDDNATTPAGTPVTITVLGNDSDPNGDTLTVTSVGTPSKGTAVKNSNGTITYTPASGFTGTATFTYTVSDGKGGTDTATVTVTVVNSPPKAVDDNVATSQGKAVTFAVLGNDSDPNGDTLTITSNTAPSKGTLVKNSNGTFTYTPTSSFYGTVTFTYAISDGKGGTDTATVTIAVSSCNDKSCHGGRGHGHHDGDGCSTGNHGHWDGDDDHGNNGGHHDGDGCANGTHDRRMTGGGSVFTSANERVTHGMELRCAVSANSNLEVNWGGDRFKLSALTAVTCSDSPSIGPGKPVAGFDTITGAGTGSYNGQTGATVSFVFTDGGEPGRSDNATIVVKDKTGKTVLTVTGSVSNGNQQAHGG